MSDQIGLVLEEVRACRSEISEMRVKQEARLTALEVHDKEIHGNGQPGWKEKYDSRIKRLETKVLLVTGGATALGFAAHFLMDLFRK